MPEELASILRLVGALLLVGAAVSGSFLFLFIVFEVGQKERIANLWALFLFCLFAGLVVMGVAFVEKFE